MSMGMGSQAWRRAGTSFVLLAVVLCAGGCNAIFDIRAGQPRTGCKDEFIIDDLEDGDGEICDGEASAKRKGSWYTLDDGTGTVTPAPGEPFLPTLIPGGRDGSVYAAHMNGSNFALWGARMGLNLYVVGLGAQSYDASSIGGITFWLKSNAPVALELPIPATIPMDQGAGACEDKDGARNCGNHFQFPILAPDPDSWVEYHVPFSALIQGYEQDQGGNTITGSASFSPGQLVSVQFVAPQASFDVWVDDISFYSCTGKACLPTCTDPTRPQSCPAKGDVVAGCWPQGAVCDTVPVIANSFFGVWESSPRDLWIVGIRQASRPGFDGTVVRWDGLNWSATPKAAPAFLTGIWGSGPGDVWAVGDKGTIVHATGAGWSPPVPAVTTRSLQSIWGSGPTDVWAVGYGGTIVRWDGADWKVIPSGTTQNLFGVGGTGPGDVWAVGLSPTTSAGVIVHWDGLAWKGVSGGSAGAWFGVWAAAPDDAWAVGAAFSNGSAVAGSLHWNGSRWSPVAVGSPPTTVLLWSVWGSGSNDVWAVGDLGTIFHWDGALWSPVESTTKQRLVRVWGTGPGDVWAVGDFGTIVHWNGTGWAPIPPDVIQVETK
jgi:hypothetical protein